MIERFLKQTHFTSEQDFKEHLEFIIPEDFNFADRKSTRLNSSHIH